MFVYRLIYCHHLTGERGREFLEFRVIVAFLTDTRKPDPREQIDSDVESIRGLDVIYIINNKYCVKANWPNDSRQPAIWEFLCVCPGSHTHTLASVPELWPNSIMNSVCKGRWCACFCVCECVRAGQQWGLIQHDKYLISAGAGPHLQNGKWL